MNNKNIIMVMGKPNTGKSASVRNIANEKNCYLNTDLKELPMKGKFLADVMVSDSMEIFDYLQEIEGNPNTEGAVLDTLTFLMSMYERQYVISSSNTQKAWGDYGNYYRELIHTIKSGSKNYVIMAHEDTTLNEQTAQMESRIPIKGSVGKIGVEADFSIILNTQQVPVKKLEAYQNDLLHITDEEREDGVKYVFCTRINKENLGGKMRSPIGLWKREELYIDNDVSLVFQRLKEYYK